MKFIKAVRIEERKMRWNPVRGFTTMFYPPMGSLDKVPVSLKHNFSPYHHELIHKRIAILQTVIPREVSLTFEQLSYCIYEDAELKIPSHIFQNKKFEAKFIEQRNLSNHGYSYLYNYLTNNLKEERVVGDSEILANSFLSPIILGKFLLQFNALVDKNQIRYKGCYNDKVQIKELINLKDISCNQSVKLSELPRMRMNHSKTPQSVKIPRNNRHRILTSILGMVVLEYPDQSEKFMKEWLFYGRQASPTYTHRGLLELVVQRWGNAF